MHSKITRNQQKLFRMFSRFYTQTLRTLRNLNTTKTSETINYNYSFPHLKKQNKTELQLYTLAKVTQIISGTAYTPLQKWTIYNSTHFFSLLTCYHPLTRNVRNPLVKFLKASSVFPSLRSKPFPNQVSWMTW